MSVSDDRCLNVLMAAGKGLINRELAESMLGKVQKEIDQRMATGQDQVQSVLEAIKEALTKDSVNAAKYRLRALQDESKDTLLTNRTTRAVGDLANVRGRKAGDIKGSDMFDAVRSVLHGINTVVKGARQSLESSINDGFKRMQGAFGVELGNSGLTKLAQSGKF